MLLDKQNPLLLRRMYINKIAIIRQKLEQQGFFLLQKKCWIFLKKEKEKKRNLTKKVASSVIYVEKFLLFTVTAVLLS